MALKRLEGFSKDSPIGKTIAIYDVQKQRKVYKEKPCWATCLINKASIEFEGKDKRYRPYLRLDGCVSQIKGDFGYDIGAAMFSDEVTQPKVHFYYNFTNEELADMVNKGLYDKNFAIPDVLIDNEYELPVKCDVVILPTDTIPILMADVCNPFNIDISSATTGYDLNKYFDVPVAQEEVVEENAIEYESFNKDAEYLHQTEVTVEQEQTVAEEIQEEEEQSLSVADSIMQDVYKSMGVSIDAEEQVEEKKPDVFGNTDDELTDDEDNELFVESVEDEEDTTEKLPIPDDDFETEDENGREIDY